MAYKTDIEIARESSDSPAGFIYIVKQTLANASMDVKVKLRNMQLWIMDFRKEKPDDRAQILQLEFMNELYYK